MQDPNDVQKQITGLALFQQYATELEDVLKTWETENEVLVQDAFAPPNYHVFPTATKALSTYRNANNPDDFYACMAFIKSLAIYKDEKNGENAITEPTLVKDLAIPMSVQMNSCYGEFDVLRNQYASKRIRAKYPPISRDRADTLQNVYSQHAGDFAHTNFPLHIRLTSLENKLAEFYRALHNYRRQQGDPFGNDTYRAQVLKFINDFHIPDMDKSTYIDKHRQDIRREAFGQYEWKTWVLIPIFCAITSIATFLWLHEQGPGVTDADPERFDYTVSTLIAAFVGIVIGGFSSSAFGARLLHQYTAKWENEFDNPSQNEKNGNGNVLLLK